MNINKDVSNAIDDLIQAAKEVGKLSEQNVAGQPWATMAERNLKLCVWCLEEMIERQLDSANALGAKEQLEKLNTMATSPDRDFSIGWKLLDKTGA
jgi:hypothetical protein